MQDSLKNYIEHTREYFDRYPFDSDRGWAELSGKVKAQNKRESLWKTFGRVACFAGIIVCTIFFANPPDNSSEIAELEQYYNSEINQKVTLIRSQLHDDSIFEDLEAMDAAFAELKADLNEHVDDEEVIIAIMENYRLKLKILEEILNQIEREKREKHL